MPMQPILVSEIGPADMHRSAINEAISDNRAFSWVWSTRSGQTWFPTNPDYLEGLRRLKENAKLPFVNVGASVMRGPEAVATARSTNMAKRIAAALNWYRPGPRGA